VLYLKESEKEVKKMKINEIHLNRKFNLGNFENVDIGISISLTAEEQKDSNWENLVKEISLKLNSKIKEILEEVTKK